LSAAFFALAILWTAAIGHRAARGLSAPLSTEEKLAWGLGVGLLIQAAIYVLLLFLRLRPGPVPMVLIGLPVALLAGRAKTGLRRPSPRISPAAWALLAVAGIAWILFLLSSIGEPMWANDFVAIWGFKARTIFLSSSIPQRLFHDPATAWSHPEYPLLLPLFFASIAALAGSWNDQALALLYPALSASIAAGLFGFLRRRGSSVGGGLAALLASLFFFLFQPFETGMAEIPLALAIVLLASSAVDLEESSGIASAWRVAVGAFLCCGLKQEGTLFVLLLAAAMAFRLGKQPRRLARALLPVGAAVLQWAILRAARGPIADRDYDLTLLRAGNAASLLGRLGSAAAAAVARFGPLAIPAAAVALVLLLTPRSRLDWMLPLLAAQLLAYVGICAFSSIDPAWEAQFIPRISTVLFPVLCAVLGDRVSRTFEARSSTRAVPG
jgi:hypothetical protein